MAQGTEVLVIFQGAVHVSHSHRGEVHPQHIHGLQALVVEACTQAQGHTAHILHRQWTWRLGPQQQQQEELLDFLIPKEPVESGDPAEMTEHGAHPKGSHLPGSYWSGSLWTRAEGLCHQVPSSTEPLQELHNITGQSVVPPYSHDLHMQVSAQCSHLEMPADWPENPL